MNKKFSVVTTSMVTLLIILISYLVISFDIETNVVHEYYQVYLSGKLIGLIDSSEELYDMIDKEQQGIKDKYGVDKIYPPSGLEVQKVNTYKSKLMSVREVYDEIKDLDPFTIEGYVVKITEKDKKDGNVFYILNKSDLDVALKNTVEAFVDPTEYKNYLDGIQKKDGEEGTEITDIYFDQNVTIKKAYISTEENIITNSQDLSRYFLFGKLDLNESYTVKSSDTIESIAYNNELGVSDFLIANPNIVGENALLAIGQEVVVAPIDPIANIVVESFETSLIDVDYDTKIEYDKNKNADSAPTVKQEGSKGVSKVTYATKYMNGVILQTAMVEEEVISEPVDKILVYGAKNITYVGNSTYWAWPTSKPYRISSYYGYRIHPIDKYEKFHSGIDITGTKSNNLYAIQSGEIIAASENKTMGKYIKIDHKNGYVSVYMHCNKLLVSKGDKVEKGQLIGIMGCTGTCTGKHLHLTIYKDNSMINPLNLYK